LRKPCLQSGFVFGVVWRKVALTWCEVQNDLHRVGVSSRQSYDESQVGATPAILEYVSFDHLHLELSVRGSVQAGSLAWTARKKDQVHQRLWRSLPHSLLSQLNCPQRNMVVVCSGMQVDVGVIGFAQTKGWTLPSFRFLGFGLRSARPPKVKRKIAIRASSLPYLAHRLQASFIIPQPMP
jgi:hypothetical protein